jgi:hypothetical protein
MSGPSRELPPIHVKITADPSSYVKALEKMVDAARKAAADISKSMSGAKLGIDKQRDLENTRMQKANQARVKEMDRSRREIEKQNRLQEQQDERQLRRSRLRQVRTGRARQEAWQTSWRNPTTWDGRISRGMERGGNNMMGARADMYMHRQSLTSMIGGAASFVKPLAEFQNYAVGIRQFTGSAQEAKQVLDDLQEFALLSPYTMSSVMEGTTLMMRYGMEAKDAVDTTRMLGDVAGGNAEKLRLLALAVGQTTSIGRLQGQELRQMTEHGFNPLQIAAEHMLGPNASKQDIKDKVYEFSKAMRAGRIDAEFVVKALEVGTAQGGKYAGQMAAYNKTIDGMTNQILETMTLVKKEIAAIFEKDIEKLLAQVLRYTNALVLYLKDAKNADTIKSYALLAAKVFGAVAAFHAFGMAVAYSKWMLGSLAIVIGTIWKLLLPFRWLLGQLAWLFVRLGISAVTALAPVIGSLTAMQWGIIGVTTAAVALGATLAYVLYNANSDVIKYNQELAKAAELQDELSGKNNRRHRQEIHNILSEQDPAKRKKMAENLTARYTNELSGQGGMNDRIAQQKALVAAYEPQATRAFQSAQLPLTKQDYEQGRTVGRVVGRNEWAGEVKNLETMERQRKELKDRIESMKDQFDITDPTSAAGGGPFDPSSWLKGLEPYLKDLKEIETKKLDGPVDFNSMIRPEDPEEVKAAKRRMGLGGVSNAPAELPMPTLVGTSTHAERLFKYDQMMKGATATGTPAEQKQISLLERIAKNTQFINSAGGFPDMKQPSPQWASFVSGPTN